MSAPQFIDNRDGNTLASSLESHLATLRKSGESPDELCIATGYFNAAGWLKVAKEAERIGKVRLLIGAEPTPSTEMTFRQPGDPREPERTKKQVAAVLEGQKTALQRERDQGFEFTPDEIGRLKKLFDFFRSGRVEVRRYEGRFFHAKAWLLRGKNRGVIAGSSNLTAAGMQGNLELNLGHYKNDVLSQAESWYDEVWDQATPFDLAQLYEALFEEFSPWMIYLRVLFELYAEELYEEKEEAPDMSLTRFQQHGIWRAQKILDELKGVIIADGVGLGKTFTAGAMIREYLERRQRVLLVRPASLQGTWEGFLNDHMMEDVECISYQKLAGDHQLGGEGRYLKRGIDEYQLIVVDEAHNYRNPDAPTRADILRKLMRGKRNRELILLTATPVNNSLYDLYHLIGFFIKQDSRLIKKGIPSIKELFDKASKEEPENLSPDLLYPLVDATTVKRTRQFIKKHYSDDRIKDSEGRLVPIHFAKPIAMTVRYDLDDILPGFFEDFAEKLMPEEGEPVLTMARYQVERYSIAPEDDLQSESTLVALLRSGLLKRFESSAHAFGNTCQKMAEQHRALIRALDEGYVVRKDFYKELAGSEELDEADFQEMLEQSEHKEPITLFEHERLRNDVENDLALLQDFADRAGAILPENDPKLQALVEELVKVATQAESDAKTDDQLVDNRKVLIFSFYKDTALWIHRRLTNALATDPRLECYRNRLAITSGSPDEAESSESVEAAWGFAPKTAAPSGHGEDKFDILVTTDVLAEGVNLQQCRNIINFDLPWNPMRLIQRHGRIDRLLSEHDRVFLRTFFPDAELDRLLRLEARVKNKLAMAAAAVGVAESPIEHGAEGQQSFTDDMEEIERLKNEDATLFERGGTEVSAQTGEEYRQELREAFESGMKKSLEEMPWKSGSGMQKEGIEGFFFCSKIGDTTFLRFVPDSARESADVIQEVGTCLRFIECDQETPKYVTDQRKEAAYHAWTLARESIQEQWDYFTDPKNLQPKVRKLNREINEFLLNHPPADVTQSALENIADKLMSPWPRREENKLRQVWNEEYKSDADKSADLIEAINLTGIQPYEPPERFPRIDSGEIRLVCWLSIQSVG